MHAFVMSLRAGRYKWCVLGTARSVPLVPELSVTLSVGHFARRRSVCHPIRASADPRAAGLRPGPSDTPLDRL